MIALTGISNLAPLGIRFHARDLAPGWENVAERQSKTSERSKRPTYGVDGIMGGPPRHDNML